MLQFKLDFSAFAANSAVGSSFQEAAERLTLFTAEEEIFAFQRTVSRLTEMQTESYWMEGDRSRSKKHMNT